MTYLLAELKHLKTHWFSCLISCLAAHMAMEAAEWLLEVILGAKM
jgi:hypothetical protein